MIVSCCIFLVVVLFVAGFFNTFLISVILFSLL